MRQQGYNARLDESLGAKSRGKKMKQSLKSRRDESKGMEKAMGKRAYSSDKSMDKSSSSAHKKAGEHLRKAHELLSKMHEAAAGRAYNRSAKHRKAESVGMKRAMKKK